MSKVIWYCKNISEKQIVVAVKKGAKKLKDIQEITTAYTRNECKKLNLSGKCCSGEINRILSLGKENTNSCSCCS